MKYLVIYLIPVILVLFVGSSILSANSAFGLSCDATNMMWSFEETDVIFLGKALSKEYQPNPTHEDRFDAVTLFSIIEPYKGFYQEKIKVTSSEWLWGVNFTENSNYVVFANNNDGNLEHALCTPTQLASESNISEIRKISQNYILPPLVQSEFGASLNEIQCKQNLVLIQKYDGSPACVKPETVPKLVEREWGASDNWIKISNANTAIHYETDASTITSIEAFSEYKNPSLPGETKQTWLKISLESKQNGILQITLPRNLIDSKIENTDDGFFVLLDGTETEYDETKTESERILRIPFSANTDIVEIIGYGHYNSDLEQLDE